MYIMSADNCKNVDKYAIEQLEIPSIILMENAANEVYLKIKDKYSKFIIICGTGNNGGDGLAIGRKLLLNDKDVKFILISPKENYSVDFTINLNILMKLNADITYIKENNDINKLQELIKDCDVLIDAIFGVGINRPLNEFYNDVIKAINLSKKEVISIDVPSGLDCNTGLELGNVVKSNITYTFEVIKKGFINYKSFKYIGNLEVIPIGIPEIAKDINSEKIYIMKEDDYKKLIIKRKLYGHKGDYGKASIFAGSLGFTGAAYITTEACVKTGSGLTTLIIPDECEIILASKLIEAMTLSYSQKDKILKKIKESNIIAFGPGISSSLESEELLKWIGENTSCTIVVDAEGINILSKRRDILNNLKGRLVLTPHPGEMSRLINKSIEYIESNRIEVTRKYAKDNECIVLLKGYNTVVSDGESVFINNTGNSKMATGGMGDCLTGIITSLIGQGYEKFTAVLLGAYIHGKCGDIESDKKYSVLATDVINNIPFIMNKLILS